MKKAALKRSRGFTLAEAMMAMVILGIAASGLLLPFTTGTKIRGEGARMTLAARIGSDLMERIIATDYNDIISDWDGYSENQGQVKDCTGAAYSGSEYAGFRRQVSCETVYVPQESSSFTPQFILAKVFVYFNSREIAVIDRLIAKE